MTPGGHRRMDHQWTKTCTSVSHEPPLSGETSFFHGTVGSHPPHHTRTPRSSFLIFFFLRSGLLSPPVPGPFGDRVAASDLQDESLAATNSDADLCESGILVVARCSSHLRMGSSAVGAAPGCSCMFKSEATPSRRAATVLVVCGGIL